MHDGARAHDGEAGLLVEVDEVGLAPPTSTKYALSSRRPNPRRRSFSSTQTEWMHSRWPPASWVPIESWVSAPACVCVPHTNPTTAPQAFSATTNAAPASRCRNSRASREAASSAGYEAASRAAARATSSARQGRKKASAAATAR